MLLSIRSRYSPPPLCSRSPLRQPSKMEVSNLLHPPLRNQLFANTTPLQSRSASMHDSLGGQKHSKAATTSGLRSSSEDRGHESEKPFSSPPSSPCGNAKWNLGFTAGSRSNGQLQDKGEAVDSPPRTPQTRSQSSHSSSPQYYSNELHCRRSSSSSSVDESHMRRAFSDGDAETEMDTNQSTPAPLAKKRRIIVRLGKRDDAGDANEEKIDDTVSNPSLYGDCQRHDTSLYCNAASSKVASEENDVACILLSLGHSAKTVNAFKADFSERTQRAIRRTQTETIKHHRRSSVVKKNSEKAVVVKTEREPIESASNLLPLYAGNPDVNLDEIRVFPPTMPLLTHHFPLWYRRFPVPSQMSAEVRAQVFKNLTENDDREFDGDETLRAAFARSQRQFGIWKDPENLFDLYTPRWMRSVGRDKEAMCSICYEEGRVLFLKTKTSQYNYHLINQHGISPITRLPLDPPINFRQVNVTKPGALDRHTMLQGECHVCSRFVSLQSVREGEVNIPEIYWWKHASQCHKRLASKSTADEKGVFLEDELYHRVKEYSQNTFTDSLSLNGSDEEAA